MTGGKPGRSTRSNGGLSNEEAEAFLASFGGRVRQRRMALGIGVRVLGEHIGLSSASVCNIERNAQGAINILTLAALRRALDSSADWLLDPGFYVPTGLPMPVMLRAGDGPPRCIGYASGPAELPSLLRGAARTLNPEWLTGPPPVPDLPGRP